MMHLETPPPRLSVLVADDDDEMRMVVAETLRHDGHDVVEARDGVDLLARLNRALDESLSAVVVVTDIVMPNLSGLDVLAVLHRSRPQVPVILMTALEDESVRSFAESLGVVTVFRKPFDVDDLRTAVVNAQLAHATAFRGEPH